MTRTPSQVGTANRRAGKAWQTACPAWLRGNGFPNAEYQIRNGVADLTGTGDVAVECTLEPWKNIAAKLEQAAHDARALHRPWWVVWKKARGHPSPGDGFVVTRAHVFWDIMATLDRLQQREAARQLLGEDR